MMEDKIDYAEIRARILLKSLREQTKHQFALALLRAVRASARENHYRDGFVEWDTAMENEIDDWEKRISALHGSLHG